MSTTGSRLDRPLSVGLKIWVGAVSIFLISPILMIIPMSFSSGRYLEFPPPGWSLQWYLAFLSSPEWMGSLSTSIIVAALTTLFSLLLGLPAALALARGRFTFRPLFFSAIALPIVFPVIALAVSLYYLFSLLHLIATPLGLALAHTVLALPVATIPLWAALRQIDQRVEWQALSLGATKLQTLATVTIPLISPAMITAALFAFVTSFDEVVVAIFLTGGDTVTLPVRIWQGLRFEIDPTVTVVASFLLVTSVAVLAAVFLIERFAAGSVSQRGGIAWKPAA